MDDQKIGHTLKRPVQVVKKRSGPLEDALNELERTTDKEDGNAEKQLTRTTTTSTPTTHNIPSCSTTTVQRQRNATALKEKEKTKRERWLLTRKTWKYMTDAGRKLIPEGVQNRKEDIPKIEEHFNQVCAAEPRFLLWRRKLSYPGATRQSKRRLKQILRHTASHKQNTLKNIEQEEANNCDNLISLLQAHLKYDEVFKTATLLDSKTVRPDQTISPSAQRPTKTKTSLVNRNSSILNVQGATPTNDSETTECEEILTRLRALSQSTVGRSISLPLGCITPALLQDKSSLKIIYNALRKQQLHRTLSKHSTPPPKPPSNLMHSLSLSSLLMCDVGGRSGSMGVGVGIGMGMGMGMGMGGPIDGSCKNMRQNIATPKTSQGQYVIKPTTINETHINNTNNNSSISKSNSQNISSLRPSPPNTLNLSKNRISSRPTSVHEYLTAPFPNTTLAPPTAPARKSTPFNKPLKQLNTCGTQTNFIQLNEIKRLAEEYKVQKREEAAFLAADATDSVCELEKSFGSTTGTGSGAVCGSNQRRRSSIDNEDVSQSVSDTIKRYLRMARKKSVHDDDKNRFKRVNYDRNLRNIRAKGEINPPGIDEDNSKAAQTLDAWAVITLDFIRGQENSGELEAAHKDWSKALEERLRRKMEFEMQQKGNNPAAQQTNQQLLHNVGSGGSSASAPTSPTSPKSGGDGSSSSSLSVFSPTPSSSSTSGFLHTGTQFFSNIWRGTTSPPTSSTPPNLSQTQSQSQTLLSHQRRQQNQNDCMRSSSSSNISLVAPNTYCLPLGMGGGSAVNPDLCHNVNDILDLNMQKSKSSSHVGQFVTRKIIKSRSKSQTRPTQETTRSKWAPSDIFTWSSDNGERLTLTETVLPNLTDIEATFLKRVAIAKLNELNIGISIPTDYDRKTQKRRLLPKKKAITTSLFDIVNKKEDQGSTYSVFGSSLECCLASDRKRYLNSSGLRGSITSTLFSGKEGNHGKLKASVRSCESLPSSTATHLLDDAETKSTSSQQGSSAVSLFGGLAKSTSMQISNSSTTKNSIQQEFDTTGGYRGLSELALADESLNESRRSSELQVPRFVSECVQYLEKFGLDKIGLFRVSTSKKRVKQMREDFNKNTVMHIEVDTCPHDVATLLKEFLRELPEPLICSNLYKPLLETQRIRNRRLQLEAISHLIKLLPVTHRDTLYVILKFLAKVAAHSDDVTASDGSLQISGNKMDSSNLATVFAPNILRPNILKPTNNNITPASYGPNEHESMSDAINVVRIMIDHYEELFKVPAELIDIVYSQMLDECPDKLYTLCEDQHKSARARCSNFDSLSSSPISSPDQLLSPPPQNEVLSRTARKLYQRGSVVHNNDASTVPDVAANSANVSKRYSVSKEKPNSESALKALGYDASLESSGGYRRKSSPNLLHQPTNVLSASLHISLPKNVDGATTNQQTDARHHAGNKFTYTDTSYADDEGSSAIVAATNLRTLEPSSTALPLSNPAPTTATSNKTDIPKAYLRRKSKTKDEQLFTDLTKKKTTTNEPGLPASISNIGGEILRSKTADFERMTSFGAEGQQLKSQRISTATAGSGAAPSSGNVSNRGSNNEKRRTNVTPTSATTATAPKMYLYKRGELISSKTSTSPR